MKRRRRIIMRIVSILLLVIALMLFSAGVILAKVVMVGDQAWPVVDISDVSSGNAVYGNRPSGSPGDTIGWTYYDVQHSGTVGKQISSHESGDVQFSWMCATNSNLNARHIHYNYWVADSGFRWPGNPPPGGIQVDYQLTAGFTTCDQLSDGRAVIAFHERVDPSAYYTAVAVEIAPGLGVFDVAAVDTFTWEPANIDSTPLWPQVAVDKDDNIHVISMNHTPFPGDHMFIAYSRSTDNGWTWEPWFILDTLVYNPSYTVQTSRLSPKVGIVYTAPREGIDPKYMGQWANDLYYWESEDGGASWVLQRHNVTQWAEDDSFRCYADGELIYDSDDFAHFAFTVYKAAGDSGVYSWYSMVLHSDIDGSMHRLSGRGWPPDSFNGWWFMENHPGALRMPADRPNFSVTDNNDLLCIFVGNTDEDISLEGWPNGEVYIVQSTDGGLIWGWEGIGDSVWNVTQSPTPGAIPGLCDDDDYPCIAEVSPAADGSLSLARIMFVNDKNAGSIGESTVTNNPLMFTIQEVGTSLDIGCEFNHFPGWVPRTGTLNFAMTWINPGDDPVMVEGKFEFWRGGKMVKTIPYAPFELPSGSKTRNYALGPVPGSSPVGYYTIVNHFTADGDSCSCEEEFEVVPIGWVEES
jgi:hypothetical protein